MKFFGKLLQDERGATSTARVLLFATIIFVLVLVGFDSTTQAVAVSTDAYTTLGGMVAFLSIWAGGPRAMEYIGPQIGTIFSRLGTGGSGSGSYSGPNVRVSVGDDPTTDDERG